jgi:hypothetical protein
VHPHAYRAVGRMVKYSGLDPFGYWNVLDVGSRDINSTIQDLDIRGFLPNAKWTGVDIQAGPNVDLVGDMTIKEQTFGAFDLAVSTETFEHVAAWGAMLRNMAHAVQDGIDGGTVIITCAGNGRIPHGSSGEALVPGEFYANVDSIALEAALRILFSDVWVDYASVPHDVYALAKGVKW